MDLGQDSSQQTGLCLVMHFNEELTALGERHIKRALMGRVRHEFDIAASFKPIYNGLDILAGGACDTGNLRHTLSPVLIQDSQNTLYSTGQTLRTFQAIA